MTHPEQGQDAVRIAYDAVANLYADHFPGTEPEQPIDLAMMAHFVQLLPQPKEVLDAGCGAGRMLPELARRGARPIGVDLSATMIERAQADHRDFPTKVGSLSALPLPDASMDGVLSWYSTIHAPDRELPTMLAEIRRVLRPGGLALLAFQSGDRVRDVAPSYARHGHDIALVRYERTAEVMLARAADAGLVEAARLTRAGATGERGPQSMVIVGVT